MHSRKYRNSNAWLTVSYQSLKIRVARAYGYRIVDRLTLTAKEAATTTIRKDSSVRKHAYRILVKVVDVAEVAGATLIEEYVAPSEIRASLIKSWLFMR